MNKRTKICLVISAICAYVFSSAGYAQGDNAPDPLVNLALVDGAMLTGSIPNERVRGIPEDILWDPAANDWATASDWHEYGMAFDSVMAATENDPVYWQVEWPTVKNINYITCSGVYPNQPQPTTGWSVQIMVDDEWRDLAKAHNGWDADTLSGAGVGIPVQTHWLWDGQLVWRGLEPVVTTGVRFTAYANPDSVADCVESFADSLWSFAWTGRDFGTGTPKAVLIQYLDLSDAEADNEPDPMINLALLDEAVVSANFKYGDIWNIRNQPADVLYDPLKEDFHVITSWGEFGYPYQYEAGYPEGPDDGFQYMIEWPVPKRINYFTWGGVYGHTPQSDTPWALQYWDGQSWKTLIDGIGGSWYDRRTHEYDTLRQYTPGVDAEAQSVWTVPAAEAIETKKIRLVAWSDGFSPLFDFHIRCRGGSTFNFDERDLPFKAVLVQYAEVMGPSAVELNDRVHPSGFVLHQNYPNPFNPTTVISYRLPAAGEVELSVYNLMGHKVATLAAGIQNAGLHQVVWDATEFGSGIYYCRLQMDRAFGQARKLMVMK